MEKTEPPSSRSERPLDTRSLVGLIGAPLAWLVQMWLCEPLVAHACFPSTEPISRPVIGALTPWVCAISITALVIASYATRLAWKSSRKSRREGAGPRQFLFEIGLMLSIACSVGIVFSIAAAFLVSSCEL